MHVISLENGVQTMEGGREEILVSPCTSLLQSLETVLSPSVASYAAEDGSEHSSCAVGPEEVALNAFCVEYRQERRFSDKKHSHAFSTVLTDLVQQRIVNGWITETSCDSHMLIVLKVVRLLLRDEHFLSLFVQLGGLPPVVSLLSSLGLEHLQLGGQVSLQVEVIRELTNICQKLSAGDEWRLQLSQMNLHSVLYQLLHSNDLCVVQCSLCCLIQLAKGREGQGEGKEGAELAETQGVGQVGQLFHMVREFDPTTQHLAADLLSLLAHKENFTEHFKMADGVASCLRLLKGNDVHIVQRMVNVLELLGRDPEMNDDIRVAGGIPLLLSILQSATSIVPLSEETAADEQDRLSLFELRQVRGKQDQVCYLQSACCTALTQLAISDASAQSVVQDNGVYVLAGFIRPHSSKRGGKSLVNLQCHALRALRFLFSLERNRRILRRLFPPDLFESFIDVGHYQWNIAAYTSLVDTINSLLESDAASLLDSIEALNTHRAPLFTVGKYQVVELLGAGAFGSVYKVKRKTADQLFAMKEIKITHPSLGKTRLEREKSMGKLLNEVTIMKEQLRHPGVVHYHKTFQESGHLYIVMELLEGASLYEHISSLREKGRSFTEEQIWRMFLQLVLALRYIHKEKHVVHRDLSASNVMVGADLTLTITDFGLAKQKQREMSVMNSVVGTMPYWSPELVLSEPYTEKVDIWASGCLLYLMSALQPPFSSSNPLALATKIVECDYPALPNGQYSAKVSEVIAACLTKDHEERPDAIAVGALLAGALMEEVDHLKEQVQSLQRKLDREKEKAHKHYHEALRARRTSERLKSVRSLQSSFNFDEDSPILVDLEEGPEKMSDLMQRTTSNDSVFSLHAAQGVEPGTEGKTVTPPSVLPLGSLKTGSSVLAGKPTTQTSPVVEGPNLPARHRSWSMNVSPNEGASPETLRHRRNLSAALPPLYSGRERMQRSWKGSAGVVAMSPNRLKQISDPILQFMTELHKLIAVTQAPPPTTPHPRRQVVELYKRSLFGAGSKPEDLKTELYRLSSESLEPVECLLGTECSGKAASLLSSPSTAQPKLIAAALGELHSLPSHPLPALSADNTTLNYQQLKAIIESVLQEVTA